MKNTLHPNAVKSVKTIFDLATKELQTIDKDNLLVWTEDLKHPQLIELRDKFDHLEPQQLNDFFGQRKRIKIESLSTSVYKSHFTYGFSIKEIHVYYRTMDAMMQWLGTEFARMVDINIYPSVYFSNKKNNKTTFTMIYEPKKGVVLNPYQFTLGFMICLKLIDIILQKDIVSELKYFNEHVIEGGPHVDDWLYPRVSTAKQLVEYTAKIHDVLDQTIRVKQTDRSDDFWLFDKNEKLKFIVEDRPTKYNIAMFCKYGLTDRLAGLFRLHKEFELMIYLMMFSNIYYEIKLRKDHSQPYKPLYRFEINKDRIDEVIDARQGALFINEMYYVYIVEKYVFNTYLNLSRIDWDDSDGHYASKYRNNFYGKFLGK